MRADPLTLTSIFGKDVRYVVPMFQRPYVWNMKEHWEPLWEDIRGVAERLHSATTSSVGSQRLNSVPPHFLGAIVLEQIPTPTGSIDTRSIIDGQQRLATLQVFIGAARVIATKQGMKQQARILGKLLWNDRDLIGEADHEFKVWPTNSDRDCFRSVMRDETTSSFDATTSMKLATAMHYFKNVLDSWVSVSHDEEREQLFGSLVTALRNNLKVVAIDLDSDDNSQVIFETLNARGTPLQAADLIKNLLFQRADQEGDAVEILYDKHWAPFDRESWRQEIRQGRLKRPVLDVFFGHWLAMTKESETLIHQLFPAFREHLNASRRPVADLMADLSMSAGVYRRMEQHPPRSVEGVFFQRQALMDTTTTIPLLLYVFRIDDTEFPQLRRHRLLKVLESYLVRRMLCRFTSKNYNRIFLDALAEVKTRPTEADSVILSFLRKLQGDSQSWPTDAEVMSNLESVQIYTAFPRKRVRLVLEALEQSMKTDLSEHAHPADTLTIEHILPQHWRENWPLPTGVDPEFPAMNRDRAKQTLGNLTLVTGKLNPSLSNAPWNEKKKALRKHSVLRLNLHLLDQDPEEWNEEKIAARTTELTESILELWPGPDASKWQAENGSIDNAKNQCEPPVVRTTDTQDDVTDAERVRMIIDKYAGTGAGRMLSEALVGELESWSDVIVTPGRSKKSADGLNRYIVFHRRASRVGAFVYGYPKADRVQLKLRLPREYADGRPHVIARNVAPNNVYQVSMQVNSLNDIRDALDLANAAFEDAG